MPGLSPAAESVSASDAENRLSGAVEGRLEGVVDGSVVGWAWSPGSPLERIWVAVFVDDEPVGLVPAELERVDLLAAGLGDGVHGFSVELPAGLRDGGHDLRVMAGRSNTRLPVASGFIAGVGSAWHSSNGSSATATRDPETAEATDGQAQAPASTSIASHPPSAMIDARTPSGPLATAGPLRALVANEWLRRYGPQTALAVGLFANLIVLLVVTRQLGFFHDDFVFILDRRGWSADAFLAPLYGQFSLSLAVTFKLLFATVGIHHSWPYRFVGIMLDSACAVLVYLLVSARAGRVIALVPAYLLLMLGAGTCSTDLVWITSIGYLFALAAGAAALLCLDRKGPAGDRTAAALLVASVVSSGPGLPMCAGAFAYLLATRAPWRRFWVVVAPLTLYGIWDLGYGTQGVSLSNLPRLPDFLVQMASASFAALAGLSGPTGESGFGAALLVAVIVLLVLRLSRGEPFPPLAVA